jgi:hypothetical protein
MISFITGCTRPQCLPELAARIYAQGPPDEFEWVVQIDGPLDERAAREMKKTTDGHPWIRAQVNERREGSAVTRNLALARSRGETIMCIDDDDLLFAGSARHLLAALEDQPTAFAACGEAHAFSDDPEVHRPCKRWPKQGLVPPGSIGKKFRRTGDLPVHVGACLWRRKYLIAVGGYAALPRSIDTNPLVACESVRPLLSVHVPTYLYRVHDDQMTKSGAYARVGPLVHGLTHERADAISALCSQAQDGSVDQ